MNQALGLPRLGGSVLNAQNIPNSTPAITGQITQMRNNVLPQMSLQTPQAPQVDVSHSFNTGQIAAPKQLPQTGASPQTDPKLLEIVEYVKTTYPKLSDDEKVVKIKELIVKYEAAKAEQEKGDPLQGGVRRSSAGLVEQTGVMGALNQFNPIGLGAEKVDNLAQQIPNIELSNKRDESIDSKVAALNTEQRAEYETAFNEKGALGKVRRFLYGNVDNFVRESQKNFGDIAFGDLGIAPEMVANTPGSVVKTATATLRGVTNPLDTVIGLSKLAFTKEGRELIKNRYGANFEETLTKDPVGVASDILTLVQGGAALTSKVAKLSGATNLADDASRLSNTAGVAADLGVPSLFRSATNKVRSTNLGKAPNTILDTAIGITEPLQSAGRLYEKAKDLAPVEATANYITSTATAQDKLFKAQNPSINILNKNRNIKTLRADSDRANALIVEAGHKPIDTETRRIAHEKTMESKWAEIEAKVQNKGDLTIKLRPFAYILEDFVRDARKSGLVKNNADLDALIAEARAMKTQREISVPNLEKKKQFINGIINNRGDSSIGDVYKNGMKLVTRAIGIAEDKLLSELPGEFSVQKKDFGALKATYADVLKADIKNQKAKGMGLIESYSRIEGIGDIIGGTLSVLTRGTAGLGDVMKGAGKVFLGKALKKAIDPDFLVQEGFKGLVPKNTKGLVEPKLGDTTSIKEQNDMLESPNMLKNKKFNNKRVGDIRVRYGQGDRWESKVSFEESKKIIDKLIDGVPVEKVADDYFIKVHGKDAQGVVDLDGKIKLLKEVVEGTAEHEVVHAYIRQHISEVRRRGILEEVIKSKDITPEEIKASGLSRTNYAEEALADLFKDYLNGRPQSISGKILKFIKDLFRKKGEQEKLYDDIVNKKKYYEGYWNRPKSNALNDKLGKAFMKKDVLTEERLKDAPDDLLQEARKYKSAEEFEKVLQKEGKVIGEGNSGRVYEMGGYVYKNDTANEGKILDIMRGSDNIVGGETVNGKVKLQKAKRVLSIDDIKDEFNRYSMGETYIDNNAFGKLNRGVSEISNNLIHYGDQMQVGVFDDGLKILDFSISRKTADNTFSYNNLYDNLDALGKRYSDFGVGGYKDILNDGKSISRMFNSFAKKGSIDDITKGDYAEQLGKQGYEAVEKAFKEGFDGDYIYYARDARPVMIEGTYKIPTKNRSMLLSKNKLTDSQIKNWELQPIIEIERKPESQLRKIREEANKTGLPAVGKTLPKKAVPLNKIDDELLSEARKYKSAEDFKEAINIDYRDSWRGSKHPNADKLLKIFNGKVFHGSNAVDKIMREGYKKGSYYNNGAYFSDNPQEAINYMKQNRGNGITNDILINDLSNLKIEQGKEGIIRKISKDDSGMESYVMKLKKQGFDGIKDTWGETLIWNVEKIKTPKTLTDVRKEANKDNSLK